MRVLLSEGSGLTSRQVATRLGELGHHVEILSSTPLCLTRFTRHVRALHEVPHFADDPVKGFDAADRIASARAIDALLPTQEQVAVIAALRARLRVKTVVPDFAGLRRVRDKIATWRTDQTAESTEEISRLIAEVQSATSATVEVVEDYRKPDFGSRHDGVIGCSRDRRHSLPREFSTSLRDEGEVSGIRASELQRGADQVDAGEAR